MPTGSWSAAEASSSAATAPPAASGVSARISHVGRRRWRIGCSIRKYDAVLTARVTVSRTSSSLVPVTPTVSAVSHRNRGKCHR